jgi:hypothetical protein
MRARTSLLGAMVLWSACGSTSMPTAGVPDATAASGDASGPPVPDSAPVAVAPDDAAAGCAFDRPYELYRDGGLRLYQDKSKLVPPRQHSITRDRLRGAPTASCFRTLPCDNVDALMRAIAHPDVVEAMKLATRPHYGEDPRPVDGTIFVFTRDDGRGFSVGPGNVPAGIRALEELLLKVLEGSVSAVECGDLR